VDFISKHVKIVEKFLKFIKENVKDIMLEANEDEETSTKNIEGYKKNIGSWIENAEELLDELY